MLAADDNPGAGLFAGGMMGAIAGVILGMASGIAFSALAWMAQSISELFPAREVPERQSGEEPEYEHYEEPPARGVRKPNDSIYDPNR
jgi:hypothetical protein